MSEVINISISESTEVVSVSVNEETPESVTATVTEVVEVVNVDVVEVVDGGGSTIIDTVLTVNQDGQTSFNVFAIPSGQSYLLINGIEYYVSDSYFFETVSGNHRLVWLNEFPILTNMKLILRTL